MWNYCLRVLKVFNHRSWIQPSWIRLTLWNGLFGANDVQSVSTPISVASIWIHQLWAVTSNDLLWSFNLSVNALDGSDHFEDPSQIFQILESGTLKIKLEVLRPHSDWNEAYYSVDSNPNVIKWIIWMASEHERYWISALEFLFSQTDWRF